MVEQGDAETQAGAANFAFNLASKPGLDDAQGSHAAAEEWAKSGRLIRGVPQGVPQPREGKRAFSRANKPGPAAHGSHDAIAGTAHSSAQLGSEPAIHAELIKSNAVFTGCNLHNKRCAGILGLGINEVATAMLRPDMCFGTVPSRVTKRQVARDRSHRDDRQTQNGDCTQLDQNFPDPRKLKPIAPDKPETPALRFKTRRPKV